MSLYVPLALVSESPQTDCCSDDYRDSQWEGWFGGGCNSRDAGHAEGFVDFLSPSSQSHIATDGQSVGLSKFAVLSIWGALSDERSGLSLFSHLSVYTLYSIYKTYQPIIYQKYLQGLCQSRLSTADYALLLAAFATTAV
jgi:hypothetical protein